MPYLDQYRFKYGQPPQGVGQGAGNLGDRIGGGVPGKGIPAMESGDQAGCLGFKVEFTLEEIKHMTPDWFPLSKVP